MKMSKESRANGRKDSENAGGDGTQRKRADGETLRSLGFSTEKLGNQGRGLRLTQSVRCQIHQLTRDMGLRRSDILMYTTVDAGYGGPPCVLCEEYGLMICEDGKRLRCIPLKRPVVLGYIPKFKTARGG
jgi:hypothetical protein